MAANTILTADIISKEMARILHNSTGFTKTVNRSMADEFPGNVNGYKIGDSVRINKPAMFSVNGGPNLSAQDFVESPVFVTFSTNDQRHVDVQFGSKELTLKLDDFSKRVLDPAAKRLASDTDKRAISNTVLKVGNAVIGSGTGKKLQYVDALRAGAGLDRLTCPREDRNVLITPALQVPVANENIKLFNPQSDISDIYASGYIGEGANASWMVSNLLPDYGKLPTGTLAATWTVAANVLDGGDTITLTTTQANGTVYKAGTIFTLDNGSGVFIDKINPETKDVYDGDAYQFSLAEDATVTGGQLVVQLGYPLYGSASTLQNIQRLPVAGDTIPVSGADDVGFVGSETVSYQQAVMYHKDAFTWVSVPLIMPDGVDQSARVSADGFNIRYVRQYQIGSDALPARFDILSTSQLVRPEFAYRMIGVGLY